MKHFPLVPLSDICKIQIGRTPSRSEQSFWGQGRPWLSIADMNQGRAIRTTKEQITQQAIAACNCSEVPAGTVLLSFKLSIGKVGIAQMPLYTNEAIAALPLRDPLRADPVFLTYALKMSNMAEFGDRAAMGATLNKASLALIKIPLPPLDEQRRIAVILDQAEALRAKRRQALAKLDTLTQSLFRSLDEGQASDILSVSELLDSGHLLLHKDGNHGGQYPRSEDFANDGVAFISVKAVTDSGEINLDQVDYLTKQKASQLKIGWIQAGDVLLAHNASVGRVGIYRGQFGRALIGTSLTCFRPSPTKLRTAFLAASLNSQFFQRQLLGNMGQTTRNQVPITAQKRLKIAVIPLQSQIEFEVRLDRIQAQRALLKNYQQSIDAMIQSLQYRAFRGEL